MNLYSSDNHYTTAQKSATDALKTGCQLDYPYIKKHKMIAIDSSQQQPLHADPKAILKINFTRDLEENATISFIIGEMKKLFGFFSRNCESTVKLFCFNIIPI